MATSALHLGDLPVLDPGRQLPTIQLGGIPYSIGRNHRLLDPLIHGVSAHPKELRRIANPDIPTHLPQLFYCAHLGRYCPVHTDTQ
jgi:hypothetical protein